MARPRKKSDDVIIVKKYANRRLYDTSKSSYVTLEDLAEMVREGLDFKVIDAKSEKNLTQSVLTQIIVEQESRKVVQIYFHKISSRKSLNFMAATWRHLFQLT